MFRNTSQNIIRAERAASLAAIGCLLLTLAAALPAVALDDPTYRALRDARPDGRQVAVSDLIVERDVYRFTFESGTFHFLAPVDGQTVGAVFLGSGSMLLDPANEAERRHLGLLEGDDDFEVLRDSFDSMVLLFNDGTDAELAAAGELVGGAPDSAAVTAYEEQLKAQRDDFRVNFHLRLLADLLNDEGLPPNGPQGTFMAFFDGDDLPPALALVDPAGIEATGLGIDGGEDTALIVLDGRKQGMWHLSHREDELAAGGGAVYRAPADASHYTIEARIAENDDLEGETELAFTVSYPSLRVLPVYLAPTLRLSAVERAGADGAWVPVAWVQEDEEEDAQAAVVFPEPLAAGTEVALRFVYAGEDILDDVGEGNFVVGARVSWYPNLTIFKDPATFDLTYRVPPGNQVVSVGRKVESRDEETAHISIWKAEQPIRVAGFNYGRFDRMDRTDESSGLELVVYTNPGTPDVIREINRFFQSQEDSGTATPTTERGAARFDISGPALRIKTKDLAESALVDGINSARVGTAYFGELPQEHVAITQQSQWSFGQSWPSLIFMPYIAFLDSTVRMQLGIGAGSTDLIEEVGFHELAHQWWGHLVGWASYRDQWLSEGFAQFSAGLTVEHARGVESANEFWDRQRDQIVAQPSGAVPNYEAGPITQGWRLSTHRTPAAGQLMYPKGAYVLHMLRMMMQDGAAPEPDAAFIAMMKDFVRRYSGGAPSTADFQATVQRHMVPGLNATGDGKVDWFFDQWVYGTAVPKLEADLEIDRDGRRKYKIEGEVTISEVPEGFKLLLPLYIDYGKGNLARFGFIPFNGPGTQEVDVTLELEDRPKDVLVNGRREVLVRE